jgi:soluble lytic murein transglycosylase-like protein
MKNARKSMLDRVYRALRAGLALVGFATICGSLLVAWQYDFDVPSFRQAAGEMLFPPSVEVAGAILGSEAETPLEREQRAVTEYIAKRYRVADSAASGFVAAAYRAGGEYNVDPMLVLAVMAVESRYNPVAESSVGARGLMQVMPKFHADKLAPHGGEPALLEPEVNILVGTRILREYQRRLGDTEAALQMYAGALDEPTAQYASKVFAEKARLDALRKIARKQRSA